MSGFEYRWFVLQPLLRGMFVSLAIAAFGVACLATKPGLASPAADPLALAVSTPAGDASQSVWPHVALRLWFTMPQLLPLGSR